MVNKPKSQKRQSVPLKLVRAFGCSIVLELKQVHVHDTFYDPY